MEDIDYAKQIFLIDVDTFIKYSFIYTTSTLVQIELLISNIYHADAQQEKHFEYKSLHVTEMWPAEYTF